MKDRMWFAVGGAVLAEGALFEIEPALGWTFAIGLLVVAVQELLRSGNHDK